MREPGIVRTCPGPRGGPPAPAQPAGDGEARAARSCRGSPYDHEVGPAEVLLAVRRAAAAVAIARAGAAEARSSSSTSRRRPSESRRTEQVLALVRRLADAGVGVVSSSHNLADVFEVSDHQRALLGTMVAQLETKQTNTTTSSPPSPASRATPFRWRSRGGGSLNDHGPRQVDQPVGGHRGRHGGSGGGAAPSPPHHRDRLRGSGPRQIAYYIQRVRGAIWACCRLGGLVVLSLLFWAATPSSSPRQLAT